MLKRILILEDDLEALSKIFEKSCAIFARLLRDFLICDIIRLYTPTPITMHSIYILKSKKDHNLYIGSINNLKRRLVMHNQGKVFSTKLRKPFELIYCELYRSEKDARMREKNLKLRSRAFTQLKKRIENCIK